MVEWGIRKKTGKIYKWAETWTRDHLYNTSPAFAVYKEMGIEEMNIILKM